MNKNTLLSEANIHNIADRLKAGEGQLLLFTPAFWGRKGESWIDLYHHPILDLTSDAPTLTTKRGVKKVGREDWQTGYENDRSYIFRPTSRGEHPWHRTADLPKSKYFFMLGMQGCVGRGLYSSPSDKALFIPHTGGDMEAAMKICLGWVFRAMRKPADRDEVFGLLPCLMQDLQDQTLMKESIMAYAGLD